MLMLLSMHMTSVLFLVRFNNFAPPERSRTNDVTSDAFDFITETPEFKACAVRIKKLRDADPDTRATQRKIRLAGEVRLPTDLMPA